MRYCEMTEREKLIIEISDNILKHNSLYNGKQYAEYLNKLIVLDEREIEKLGIMLDISERDYVTMRELDGICSVKQYNDLIHFLDHPESRLKNFVRYER